jgi:hypothetical protein
MYSGSNECSITEESIEKDGKMSIEEWEKDVVGWASFAQKIGIQMGNLSQFGDHPLADNGDAPRNR